MRQGVVRGSTKAQEEIQTQLGVSMALEAVLELADGKEGTDS